MKIKVKNKSELLNLTEKESKDFGYQCAMAGKDISYDPFRNMELSQSHSRLANSWIEGFKSARKKTNN